MVLSICFNIDFQRWATVCLHSIWQQHKISPKIRLIILSNINYERVIWQLKGVLNNFDFSFHNPGNDFENMPAGYHFNVATYWRLALPSVLAKQNIDKAIYLDADTLILGGLEELFNTELEGKTCGGCLDISSTEHAERMELKQRFAINGGVLLMDVERMNKIDWVEESNRLNKEGLIRWVDQDVINILLDKEIKLLDLKWNVQSGNLQNNYNGLIRVVHFTESGNTKPWNSSCKHPYFDYYKEISHLLALR